MKFTLRMLFVVVIVAAILAAALMEPFRRQERALVEFRKRDIVVATQEWYPAIPATRHLFCTPIQAQVRIRPAKGSKVYVVGKELTFAEAKVELLALKVELEQAFGLGSFALVTDDDWQGDVMKLNRLAVGLETLPTPCGIDNFKTGADNAR